MKIVQIKCWLADDGETLVATGDERAAVLLGAPGEQISDARAEKLIDDGNFLVDSKDFVIAKKAEPVGASVMTSKSITPASKPEPEPAGPSVTLTRIEPKGDKPLTKAQRKAQAKLAAKAK